MFWANHCCDILRIEIKVKQYYNNNSVHLSSPDFFDLLKIYIKIHFELKQKTKPFKKSFWPITIHKNKPLKTGTEYGLAQSEGKQRPCPQVSGYFWLHLTFSFRIRLSYTPIRQILIFFNLLSRVENDISTMNLISHVDGEIFESGIKRLQIQKHLKYTFGQGIKKSILVLFYFWLDDKLALIIYPHCVVW